MNQLQKEIYDMMPDDMPNVEAIELSSKIEQLFLNKADELTAAILKIRIDTPSDQRVVNLAEIAVLEVFKPLEF